MNSITSPLLSLNWESNLVELPIAYNYLRVIHIISLVFSCFSLIPACYLMFIQHTIIPTLPKAANEKNEPPTLNLLQRLARRRIKPRIFVQRSNNTGSIAWRPLPTECLVLALTGFSLFDILWHAMLLAPASSLTQFDTNHITLSWAASFFIQNCRYIIGYTGLTCYFVGIAYSIPAGVVANSNVRRILHAPIVMNGYLLFFTLGPLFTTGVMAPVAGYHYQESITNDVNFTRLKFTGDILFVIIWGLWILFTSMFALSLTVFGRPLIEAIEENVVSQRQLMTKNTGGAWEISGGNSKGSHHSLTTSGNKMSHVEHSEDIPQLTKLQPQNNTIYADLNAVDASQSSKIQSQSTTQLESSGNGASVHSQTLNVSNGSRFLRNALNPNSSGNAKIPRSINVLQLHLLEQSAYKIRAMVYLLPLASLVFAIANLIMISLKTVTLSSLRIDHPEFFLADYNISSVDNNYLFYIPSTIHTISGSLCVMVVMCLLVIQDQISNNIRHEMRRSRVVGRSR